MDNIQENPIIRNCELFGYPSSDYLNFRPPVCPICGEECERFFVRDPDGDIIGCDKCVTEEDAYEWQERN